MKMITLQSHHLWDLKLLTLSNPLIICYFFVCLDLALAVEIHIFYLLYTMFPASKRFLTIKVTDYMQ